MSKEMVVTKQLVFEYNKRNQEGEVTGSTLALAEVDLGISPGSFVAILGSNGSGKSTLAKHLNALLLPTRGSVWVNGLDTKNLENLLNVRQSAGMVFQNPDNQIIGTVVEEDVGFGPENVGIPTDEIWKRVEDSLRGVGMWEYRHHSPNKLSGGQKQRVAIAGVLAMEPHCIVLDEATAMLDPEGRKEVFRCVEELRKKKKVTVIWITHFMEEVTKADKIFVMDKGKIVMEGTPREIFSEGEKLRSYHLDVPQISIVADELRELGFEIPKGIVEAKELVAVLCKGKNAEGRIGKAKGDFLSCEDEVNGLARSLEESLGENREEGLGVNREEGLGESSRESQEESLERRLGGSLEENSWGNLEERVKNLITLDKVTYTYNEKTPNEKRALKEINLEIPEGEMLGIIGHTGSGKSTLVQQMNGLLKAGSGRVLYDGENIHDTQYELKKLRTQVGMVFQYPEHQLFEIDIMSDVCYGPKNQGLSEDEARERGIWALELVGFPKEYYHHSPFELSGGQKRRAAIAGVLAMKPKVLILDEPTAGLDPKGRDEILNQIARLHRETGITVILVSHSMEIIAKYVKYIIVLNQGEVMLRGEVADIFSHYKELEKVGLAAPEVTYLMSELREKGFPVNTRLSSPKEVASEIARCLND